MIHRTKNFLLLLMALMAMGACSKKKSGIMWRNDLSLTGSQSSPRTCDLNDDGTLDIVVGAGKNEYQQSNQGILAFDGKTGALLWEQQAPDQVYGSATFNDVTGDGVKDVFIGGRSPHFKALNGRTGEVIWEYKYQDHERDSIIKNARFNFNNSVLVPDQNNDGIEDLLTVNGGNSFADPYSKKNRFPGVLMVFDAKTGIILAADTMPDGGESYMSPLFFIQPASHDSLVVFGTGGETIDGKLYVAKLSDLMKKQLKNAKPIATEVGHGFIAPPVLADISMDGYYDIVAITHGSTAYAIDGKNHSILWRQKIKDTECSNSFAVGNFTDDDTPDFFTFVSKGQWPNSTGSLQILLNGKDGSVAYMDSLGCTGFSSPVVYDLDDNGIDEVIISINEYDCSFGFTGKSPVDIKSKLISIDFEKRSHQLFDEAVGFKNVFSTPWIGDLDNDGYLDIIHCQYYHRGDLLSFLGMSVKRIDSSIKMKKEVVWGAYMNSIGDGILRMKK